MLMIPRLVKETIKPAIIIPPRMLGNAYLNLIPNTKAATLPVHAPVTGKGMATKNNKNNAPNFSYCSSCLLVLLKSQEKNSSKQCHLLKKIKKGLKYSNKNITGKILPKTAQKYA